MVYSRVERYQVPHGVLFLYDQSEKIIVPEDTSYAPIINTENFITIWTVGEYEGEVDITLSSKEYDPTHELIFSGLIKNGGGKISVNRSDTCVICEIDVEGFESKVDIYSNGFPYSTEIHFLIS